MKVNLLIYCYGHVRINGQTRMNTPINVSQIAHDCSARSAGVPEKKMFFEVYGALAFRPNSGIHRDRLHSCLTAATR